MTCHYCERDGVYTCRICGQLLCGQHAQLRTVCVSCIKEKRFDYMIEPLSEKDKESVREFVKNFWGEEEQLTFDKVFNVPELGGFAAKLHNKMLGFVTTAEAGDADIVVALGVLPRYQGSGIGRDLINHVQEEAKKRSKKMLLVSTSNDDLPALAFYQMLGFQIFEVKPNAIAEKHGRILRGVGNLPIRDELRLKKKI